MVVYHIITQRDSSSDRYNSDGVFDVYFDDRFDYIGTLRFEFIVIFHLLS
jgi:hypothetical protein